MINRSLALVCAPVVALVLAIGDPITHRTDDQSGLGHGSRVALNSPADPTSAPPDIVLLVLDDHPPLAPSFYSALPNIKALFQDQGSNFSNFWANFSKCCPGRATLFTGQWAHHHGVTKNDALLFDPRESLATELSSVGYHTILCGKYMNGLSSLTDKTPDGWDDVAVKDSGPYFNYSAWINGVREKHANLFEDVSAKGDVGC